MSTALTAGAAPRRAAPSISTASAPQRTAPDLAARDEMRRRGATVIADKVFEKIAGQAASEVSTSRGRSGGVFGFGADADTDARGKVDVALSADSVDLDLAVGIAYPGSLRAAAQQVREHVTRRVHDLTGVPVHRVDIDIAFLDASTTSVSNQTRPHRKQVLR